MRVHAVSLRAQVRVYRAQGFSISQIMRRYALPKTTVWHYIQGVLLSPEQKKKIRSNQGGSVLRSNLERERAREEAQKLLGKNPIIHSLPLILASLYWGEGTKKGGFTFTNTDAQMIRVVLQALRQLFGITNRRIRLLIRTCIPMDPEQCKEYWHRATKVPLSNININHDDKQNKSKTQYGMCRMSVSKGGYYLKVTDCLIEELVARMARLTPS